MVGQMLAFDKVSLSPSVYWHWTNILTAHEPRSRRHRGVPPDATKGQGRARCCTTSHRDGGATCYRSYHHSRRARYLAVSGWPATRRSCFSHRRNVWRTYNCCGFGGWTWCRATSWTWSTGWTDRTHAWCWRSRSRLWRRISWRACLWRTTWIPRSWRTPWWTAYASPIAQLQCSR